MGVPWHEGRLCLLDLETTSADPEEARIVTAAVGYVHGGRESDMHTLLANPGVPIPPEATRIHGITTERARRYGRPIDEVLDIVLGFLDNRPPGSPIIAYNTPYDLTVLDREARRQGYDPLDAHRPLLVVDPLVMDKHLHRYRPGSRKLIDTCRYYHVKLEAAHAAGADAIAAGRLAWVLAKRVSVTRRVRSPEDGMELEQLQTEWLAVRDNLEQLHQAQARWYTIQARGLADYFNRKGQDHDVRAHWPLIPLGAPALRPPQEQLSL